MLLTKEGHIKLTDFGLSRISMPEQESENQNPEEMLKHLDEISARFSSSPEKTCQLKTSPQNSLIHGETSQPKSSKKKPSSSSSKKQILGTPDYLAPELLMGLTHGNSVDWWALGICIFEWLVGFPPFTDETPELVFRNILSHNVDWPEDEFSPSAVHLITSLMNFDPLQRYKADDVKNQAFFSQLNWETIRDQPAPFIPNPTNITDTSYFDERGGRPDPTEESEGFSKYDDDSDSFILLKPKGNQDDKNSYKAKPKVIDRSTSEQFREFAYTNIGVLGDTNLRLKQESSRELLAEPRISVNSKDDGKGRPSAR
jgi:serine/threonine protein kinase